MKLSCSGHSKRLRYVSLIKFDQHYRNFPLNHTPDLFFCIIQMLEILNLMLREVEERLSSLGVGLEVSEAVKDLICEQGYDPTYGARPLRRAVTLMIENPLSESLLSGDCKAGDVAVVELDDSGNPVITNQSNKKVHLSDSSTTIM